MKPITEIMSEATDFADLVRRVEEEYGDDIRAGSRRETLLRAIWDEYQEEKAEK